MTSIELEEHRDPLEVVPYEIECPRCYGSMTLLSESETLEYGCEDCDFILHTVVGKKE